MLSPELIYIQIKFGVNPFISFEVTGQNVILYIWPMWNGNGYGSSWLVLHFQVLLDSMTSLDAMLLSPAISPQTWWQTDRQTHRQTEWLGEKHNTFFQRYNKLNLIIYHVSLYLLSRICIYYNSLIFHKLKESSRQNLTRNLKQNQAITTLTKSFTVLQVCLYNFENFGISFTIVFLAFKQ